MLTGTKFGPKSIPLLAQIHKKGTLCGTIGVKKWFIGTIIGVYHQKFGQLSAFFYILHSSWHNQCKNQTLAHIWCSKPYP